MSTVMFAWELGGGLGHMLQLLPLARGLASQGHRVFVALRNLAGAAAVFGRAGVSFLPAPYKAGGRVYFRRTQNFAHILANVGWGSFEELFGLSCAWRNLLRFVRPDLIVCDHSPTALLSSRGIPGVRRVVLGSGFLCPPDAAPFPPYRPGEGVDLRQVAADEHRVLARANRVLGRWGKPPLRRLGELYSQVDETFLLTFPELDHFGERPGVRYWGPVNGDGRHGRPFEWPRGATGPRVYGYLKRCAALPQLLEMLRRRSSNTIVVADGIDSATRRQFASETLRFADNPLDLAQVGRECHAAILNANHGTLSELLLAGRPTLHLPITLEQQLLARAVCRIGAAEAVSAHRARAEDIAPKLDAVLSDQRYAEAAARFAQRHATFDPEGQRGEILNRLVGRLAGGMYPDVFR